MPKGCTIELVRQSVQDRIATAHPDDDEILITLDRDDWNLVLAAMAVAETSRDLILRLDALIETPPSDDDDSLFAATTDTLC